MYCSLSDNNHVYRQESESKNNFLYLRNIQLIQISSSNHESYFPKRNPIVKNIESYNKLQRYTLLPFPKNNLGIKR